MTNEQQTMRDEMFAAAAEKAARFGTMGTKEAVLYGIRFAEDNPRPDMIAIADVRRALDVAVYNVGMADTKLSFELFHAFENEIAKSKDKQQLSLF